MRTAFDFAPYRRSTVGFDRLFDMLENSSMGQGQENYPPFDLIKLGENDYRIELAVAGFKPDEIDITAQQNVLVVSGKKKEESESKGSDYIYRPEGRSARDRARTRDPRGDEAAEDRHRRNEGAVGDRRRRQACVAADGRCRGRARLRVSPGFP